MLYFVLIDIMLEEVERITKFRHHLFDALVLNKTVTLKPIIRYVV